MTVEETPGPDLAQLEETTARAVQIAQAAAEKVAELERQLVTARSELETAKEREMEARRAFAVAKEAQGPVN